MSRAKPFVSGSQSARAAAASRVPPQAGGSPFINDLSASHPRLFADAIASLSVHDHACLIYNSAAEQLAAIVPFVKEGLTRGERCIYISDDQGGCDITTALRSYGLEVDDAIARGQFALMTQRNAYLRDGEFDPDHMMGMLAETVSQACADGFSALRVTGEMSWTLQGLADIEPLLEYEAKLNGFFPVHACLAICQYDRRRFSAGLIRDVIRTHPIVIHGHSVCRNPFFIPPRDFLSAASADREVERLLQQLADREQADIALSESRNWLAAILDNAPIAMVIVDESGRVCHANRAAADLANQPADHMIGSLMGNALRCLNALSDPRGCGSTTSCEACEVRKAILRTHTSGAQFSNLRARIPLDGCEQRQNADVVISATPIDLSGQRMVLVSIEDVSDTVQAETSLQTFLDALPESALLMAADGRIIEANSEVAKRLGVNLDDLRRQSVFEVLPEGVRESRREQIAAVIRSGTTKRFVDWRSGRCIDNIVAPVRNSDGSFDRLAILGLDVTEREQAKTRLRESEERFRGIVENANDIIYTISPDGRLTYISPNVRELLGYEPEDVLGKMYAEFVHPENRAECDASFEHVLATGEHTKDLTYRFRHKDGSWRWHTSNTSLLKAQEGKPPTYIGIARDITERMRSEEALRQSEREKALVLGSTLELFAMYDRELRVQWANKAFCDAMALPAEEVIGRHCDGIWAGSDKPCSGCPVQKAIDTGESHEMEHATPDGRAWFLRGRPVFDDSGVVIGAVEFGQDITDRKRAEQELRQSEELLDQMGSIAKIGGWEHDLTTGAARWTRGTYQIVEIEPGEPIPGPAEHLDYYPEKDRAILDAAYRHSIEAGEPFDLELQSNTAKGRRIWTRVIGNPVFIGGKCTKMRGTFQDITQIKKAVAALRESEQRMNLALRGADLGAWDWNVQTGEVTFDDRWAEMLGYAHDELAPHVHEWKDRLHPDDCSRVTKALDEHLEGSVDSYESEYRLRHKSGEWVWILDKGRVTERDADGKAVRACGTHLDISERKRAEESLREASLWRESAIRAGNVGIWDWDLTTNDVVYSVEWKRQIGYEDHEIGRGLHEWESRVHPEDIEATLKYLKECIEAERPQWELRFRFRHKDGSYRWILAQGALIRDKAGKPVRALGTHVDITEHKRAEEALLRSKETYRALVMGLPDIVMRYDRDARHLFASENVEHAFDIPADQFIGKTHRELGFPEDLCQELETAIRSVFDSGASFETEIAFEGKHGPAIYNWRLVPERDGTGAVQSVLSISRDITEYRRTQREYQTLFTEMLNGFALHEIICDDAGRAVDYRFLAVNPAFESMTGLRADDIVGKTVMEVMPQAECSWIETYGRVALTGEPVRFGSYAEELQKNFVVTAFQPAPKQFACIFEDVSELKRAEAERRELEAQLRQSQKLEAMGQLAGGVAHDFNNLLTAITGYAELLRLSISEGTTAEQALDGIEEATHQAAGVTRSLLTFSSKMHTRKRRVDLRTVVEKSVLLLRRMMPASIAMETDPSIMPAVWLCADENQLQQAVMNLALNARDAMPEGGTLRISVDARVDVPAVPPSAKSRRVGRPGEGIVRLVVSDTGTGMTEETLKHVFEPFFSTKPRGQGTGLGLAIVHGIVTEHGGSVEVDSAVGKGTTISISLPIGDIEIDDAERGMTSESLGAQGQLVLLAEDNWNVRSIVGTVLNNCGFRVTAAADGESLMEGFNAHADDIHLLVLDVDLPRRNGWDCLREIRERGATTPAIVITGGVDTRVEEDLDEHTVLLRKPFGMPELQRLATDMVAGRGSRKE